MTRKEPRAKRIEDIINSAVDEFLLKGYESATMESIAKKAGVSKGGLYHHFKNKDEILIYANQKLSEPVYEMMVEANRNISPKEGLKTYIKQYLTYWAGHKKEVVFYFLSLSKAVSSPEIWKFYEEYAEQYVLFLETLYQNAVQKKEIAGLYARENAFVLMSALDGAIGYLIMDKKINPDSIIKNFQDRFVDSLSSKYQGE